MVEFALLIPLFMLIVMGVLDLGRGVYAYSVVANSAREGARYGTVHPQDDAGMISAARASAVALDPSQLTVVIAHPSTVTIRVPPFPTILAVASNATREGAISEGCTMKHTEPPKMQ